MCVEIDVDLQVIKLFCMHKGMFCSENCWLVAGARVLVVAVEVLRLAVEAVVAPVNSIRVEHRNDFENEFIHQNFCLLTLLILSIFSRQEIQNTI